MGLSPYGWPFLIDSASTGNPMDGQHIIRIVGYLTAGIVLIAGILVISGSIVPSYVPENFRIMVGVVLVLYGLYRPAMIYGKNKKGRRDDR